MLRLLVIVKLCEANIITKDTWNDYLFGTYLFTVFRHKLITFLQVLQSRVTVNLAVRGDTEIIEQEHSFFLLIKKEMQLTSRVH